MNNDINLRYPLKFLFSGYFNKNSPKTAIPFIKLKL